MDTRTKNVLSICSGYGGIELGLHAALDGRTRTVAYVENELGVASILAARMEDGSLDPAPIWTDLRTFDPEPWRGKVDILAGGFPCQPHSVAGSQLRADDPRELSGEVLRIADGLGLPELFLENVPGILRFYWDNIRPELREMGYQVAEGLFTASETGAPHKRERLFILANAPGTRLQGQEHWISGDASESSNELADSDPGLSDHEEEEVCAGGEPSEPGSSQLAHAGHAECQGRIEGEDGGEGGTRNKPTSQSSELAHAGLPLYPPGPNDREGWEWLLARWPELSPTYCKDGHDVQPEVPTIESKLRGASPGTPTGVDRRLRAIGNGVIPAVSKLAYRELAALNE